MAAELYLQLMVLWHPYEAFAFPCLLPIHIEYVELAENIVTFVQLISKGTVGVFWATANYRGGQKYLDKTWNTTIKNIEDVLLNNKLFIT